MFVSTRLIKWRKINEKIKQMEMKAYQLSQDQIEAKLE